MPPTDPERPELDQLLHELEGYAPQHQRHRFEGEPDEDLLLFLEPDQLLQELGRLPRAELGRRTSIALWLLRVFVVVMAALVTYTFVAQTLA